MNTFRSHRCAALLVMLLAGSWALSSPAGAGATPPTAASATTPPSASATPPAAASAALPPGEDAATRAPDDVAAPDAAPKAATDDSNEGSDEWTEYSDGNRHWSVHRHHGNDVVNFLRDSDLPSGRRADAVLSILGSSSSEGEARDVVSILGNTRVTGPVRHAAVAILGNTYADGAVDRDVVAVLGNVELGPHAVVGGDVVAIGGTVERDPAAVVHGKVQSVGPQLAGFSWLKPWIEHCLLYARPLALAPGLSWAWTLALSFLALYVGLALLFRRHMDECVQTLETQPGMTVLAALLTVLAIPVVLTLLFVTVIGIAALPFVMICLFCAGLFGKAAVLAWLGRRCLGWHPTGVRAHPALAVLLGGAIVLLLYLVPVIGFIVYKLLGLLGLGVALYTLILAARAWQAGRAALVAIPAGPAPAAPPPGGAAPEVTPTAAQGTGVAALTPAEIAARPLAGFWIRMLALLIDALLIGVVMHVLDHVIHPELVVLAIYGAVMWKLRGATIGGIVLDLRVVRLDGRPVDWETAIIRALSCFLSLVVVGLGFLWIAFDHGKQAWHDKIAGTAVVRMGRR